MYKGAHKLQTLQKCNISILSLLVLMQSIRDTPFFVRRFYAYNTSSFNFNLHEKGKSELAFNLLKKSRPTSYRNVIDQNTKTF